MALYLCPGQTAPGLKCNKILSSDKHLSKSDSIPCPFCKTPITAANVTYKSGTPFPILGAQGSSGGSKRKLSPSDSANRCGSAPALSDCDLLTTTSKRARVYEDVKSKECRKDASCLKLSFTNLISSPGDITSKRQCIAIDLPSSVTSDPTMKAHLQAASKKTEQSMESKDATESVGEAAAALYMKKTYPKLKFVWGMHVHSGAGIDQIWIREDASFPEGIAEVVVVEAKGVNATLRVNNAIPDDLGVQMSPAWVYDRLGRMRQSDVGKRVISALGLNLVQKSYAKNSQTDKNFWVRDIKKPLSKSPVGLRGIVLEAKWEGLELKATVRKRYDYDYKKA